MADSIFKLKVETSEYDQKLANAAKGIRHLADVAHQSDGYLTGLEKSELDYIKALGEMETKNRTASGQVRELSNTYKELKVVYDQLNDAEKADEGGKALAAGLETLKQRAQTAKAQLDSASQSLQDNGQSAQQSSGFLEGLASKFTINIDALKLFNVGLTAAKAALDVAKDAFFASESNVDEWGRTVQAAQGLYEGFLNAINNGDISGYLDRMSQIVQAAREAYNELDTLGTMKTIQAPQKSRQQTENERIRSMIQTGRYIAPMDGRRNAVFNGKEMQNGQLLAPEQIRILERQLQSGMKTAVTLVGREVRQTGKAIDAYYNSIAKQNGMSMKEFQKGVSSWDEFSKKMQGYENYERWNREAATEFARQGGRGSVDFDKTNPYAEFRKWGNFRVDKMGENSYNDLTQLIQQRDQQMAQAYSMQSQAYRTMNRAEGVTVSKLMKGDKGGNGGKTGKTDIEFANDSIMAQEKLVQDLTQKWKTSSEELRDGYLEQLNAAQKKLEEMKSPPDVDSIIAKQYPDMSEQNYKTGYSGSAQSRRQSLLSDYGQTIESYYNAPIGTESIRKFVGEIKTIMSEADLGSELYNNLSAKISDATIVSDLINQSLSAGVSAADISGIAQAMQQKLFSPDGLTGEDIAAWLEAINQLIEENGGLKLNINPETGKVEREESDAEKMKELSNSMLKTSGTISTLTSGIKQLTGGLRDLGIDIPECVEDAIGVIDAVSKIINGVGTIIGVFAQGAMTANTIALEVNTAALLAASVMPFSNGGIVPSYAQGGVIHAAGGWVGGHSFSGDRVHAMVNSGELILNSVQQDTLATILSNGAMQDLYLSTDVSAEDIIFILNNNGNRRGLGNFIND